MRASLEGHLTSRYPRKWLLHPFRRRRQFLFQNDFARLIQKAIVVLQFFTVMMAETKAVEPLIAPSVAIRLSKQYTIQKPSMMPLFIDR
jgi:hypothetical protein